MTDPLTCPGCGAVAPTDSDTCSRCGTDLRPAIGNRTPIKRPGTVTIIAVLNLLGGGLVVLLGLGWFAAMAEMMQDPMVIALGSVYLVIGGVGIAVGIGLLKLKAWSRVAQIVLSTIGLLGFPIGTLISVLILYYMLRPGVKLLFSGRDFGDLTTSERADIERVSSSRATALAAISVALVSVLFCGMIAAIVIPNTLGAVNRGRQKRSMSDLRTLSTALEAYRVDFNSYPRSMRSITDATDFIQPTYVNVAPTIDGWNTEFEVWSDDSGTNFNVISLGRDRAEGPRPGGTTDDIDADIVMENGRFTQWPEGIQHN